VCSDLSVSSGTIPVLAATALAARPVVRYLALLIGLSRVLNGSHQHDRTALFADFTTACQADPLAHGRRQTRRTPLRRPQRRYHPTARVTTLGEPKPGEGRTVNTSPRSRQPTHEPSLPARFQVIVTRDLPSTRRHPCRCRGVCGVR